MNAKANGAHPGLPDKKVSVSQLFGFKSNMAVHAYSETSEHVPDLDQDYLFNEETTLAILAGFAHNRRVMVTGYHGTGKSTHIEQVAARLNWPCIRINLDSHISRIDLIGKDAIVLKDGKQITEFREGILPWAYQHNVALVFDEYDAGRPDVMFVIQRILESSGKLTLLDQSRVIRPNPAFRLFATANTVGLGDTTGRHPADQPGANGPVVDCDGAQLSAAWPGSRYCSGQVQSLRDRQGQEDHFQHGAGRGSHPQRFHAGRSFYSDESTDGDHLGAEFRNIQQ
jgi:cobaltochelatase CobS